MTSLCFETVRKVVTIMLQADYLWMYLYGGFNCGNQFQFISICFRLCWWVEETFKKKLKSQIGKCWKRGKTRVTKLPLVLVSNSDWLKGCRGFFRPIKAQVKQNQRNPGLLLTLSWNFPLWFSVRTIQRKENFHRHLSTKLLRNYQL